MSRKTFDEVFSEIRESVTFTATGKPNKTFSRSQFDKLAKAFVNETEYVTNVYYKKGDDLLHDEVKPVQQFRGMLKRILEDFGVDKEESAKVLSEAYQIKNVDGLYELCSELIYKYLDAGKKFDFMTKEDFKGSIVLDTLEESVKEYPIPTEPGKKATTKKKKHKKITAKSSCPDWLKERLS